MLPVSRRSESSRHPLAVNSCVTGYPRILLVLFLSTLPLVNPIVHGDGLGYYAYVRAPLMQQRLDFTQDYQYADARRLNSGPMPLLACAAGLDSSDPEIVHLDTTPTLPMLGSNLRESRYQPCDCFRASLLVT